MVELMACQQSEIVSAESWQPACGSVPGQPAIDESSQIVIAWLPKKEWVIKSKHVCFWKGIML